MRGYAAHPLTLTIVLNPLRRYFGSYGSAWLIGAIVVMYVATAAMRVVSKWWISEWSADADAAHPRHSLAFCMLLVWLHSVVAGG